MQREDWFPVPVYFDIIDSAIIDCEEVAQECRDYRDKNEGRILSNVDGWQSEDVVFNSKYKHLEKVKNLIEDKASLVFTDYGIKSNIKPVVANGWININQNNNYNQIHNHPGVCMAAVFYVKVPEDSGRIVMMRDQNVTFFNDMCSDMSNSATYPSATYTPKAGKLLFFPAWLPHFVEPNKSKEERISIAFNVGRF